MPIIPTVITVRGDEQIEKAIASEVASDHDVSEEFLKSVSSEYPPRRDARKEQEPQKEE